MKPEIAPDIPREATPIRRDWRGVRLLLPYLGRFRGRVAFAFVLLILAKLSNVGVPLALKQIVDALDAKDVALAVPILFVVAYGFLRFGNTLFSELRDAMFARVTLNTTRRVAVRVFEHLHALSLRFHLQRRTGGLSRDIERGTNAITSLLNFLVFNVIPTLVEIGLVAGILLYNYDAWFFIIILATLIVYVVSTFMITEWRMKFFREMNEMNTKANGRAIDSLLNYETVKYFGNDGFESRQYDQVTAQWEKAALKSRNALAFLNIAQGGTIAAGLTLLMWLAAREVAAGTMTIGDLVLINTFLIQLYIPLNFLGVIYRSTKNALVDMERMFDLLDENAEVQDAPNAKPLQLNGGEVVFEHVDFSYDPARQILFDVSFRVPAGRTLAVVGSSGAGKSTLSRLLYRFYNVSSGRILIDGQDLAEVTQASVRAAIAIVPQDTVLFNESIFYNIAYGRLDATRDEVIQAAKYAHIHPFIESLPDGYDTIVGERGLKLSGGEKQRVAIARAILKNPHILIFDEATSALDSKSEKAIQAELKEIARDRTTLMIAHRLSTIIDADEILVMDHGRVVERGSHRELLDQGGMYAHMWALQQEEETLEALSE